MSGLFPDLADWGGLIPGEVEEEVAQRAETLAWSTMLDLTAGRVTLTPITVRPRATNASTATASATTTTTTTTTDPALARLDTPVGKIVEVRLSGAVLSPALYRVEDGQLRRLDGNSWPTNEDPTLAPGLGEFEVTYYRGKLPGSSFRWAVGQLAAEFYLATANVKGKKCRLPDNVVSVARQGVQYEVKPGLFSGGLTGIHEIDAVIRTYNPNLLVQPTLVMSPDSIAMSPVRVR